MKKYIYCGTKILDERAISICDDCGNQTWGERMFKIMNERK